MRVEHVVVGERAIGAEGNLGLARGDRRAHLTHVDDLARYLRPDSTKTITYTTVIHILDKSAHMHKQFIKNMGKSHCKFFCFFLNMFTILQ